MNSTARRMFVLRRMAPSMGRIPLNVKPMAAFSTECAPATKLRTVLEEYRQTNFSDELPSRFRKHIIKEIEDPNHETFQVDNLNPLLENIGRHDARLSQEELDTLLREAGVVVSSEGRHMPIDKMLQLM